mgnify:FL=1
MNVQRNTNLVSWTNLMNEKRNSFIERIAEKRLMGKIRILKKRIGLKSLLKVTRIESDFRWIQK